MKPEPTSTQLLDAILQTQEALHSFATDVDQRFGGLEHRMGGLESRMGGLEGRMDKLEHRMGGLEHRVGGLEGRLGGLENRMVTKEYLDDKLADQNAYMGGLIRETNVVIGNLTDVLVTAGSLPRPAGERIKRQRPFFRAAK